jgi:hypothetical protein
VLALTFVLPLLVQAQIPSQSPYKSFNLHELLPAAQGSAPSVQFVTENSIALCVHTNQAGCLVFVLTWDEGGVHISGSTPAVYQQLIGRAGDDHIFTTSLTGTTSSLYSITAQSLQSIPFVQHSLVSASGHLAGATTQNNWVVYRLVPQMQQVRKGSGTLLSVSDANVAILRRDNLTIETVDGNAVGSFKVKSPAKCYLNAMLLRDGLFLNTCDGNHVVSGSGKRLLKIQPPAGNLSLMATDESGVRLLLDYMTRKVSVLQSAAELAVTFASLGAGAPDQFDNGEAVRVIDTTTGAVCFGWQSSLSRTDAFFSHASIAPSGKFVAVAGPTTVSIFRLPESCGVR